MNGGEENPAKRARMIERTIYKINDSCEDDCFEIMDKGFDMEALEKKQSGGERKYWWRDDFIQRQETALREKRSFLKQTKEAQQTRARVLELDEELYLAKRVSLQDKVMDPEEKEKALEALEMAIRTKRESLDREKTMLEKQEKALHKEEEDLKKDREDLEKAKDAHRIKKQKEMEEEAALKLVFSNRSCAICAIQSPLYRSFFVGCGHITCRACAETLAMNAHPLQPACPFCRKVSEFVALKEKTVRNWETDSSMKHVEILENLNEQNEAEERRKKIPRICSNPQESCCEPGVPCLHKESWSELRWQIVDAYLRKELDERAYKDRYNLKLEAEGSYRQMRGGYLRDVLNEEYARLNIPVPYGIPPNMSLSMDRLAEFAALAEQKEEKQRLIKKLQRLNEANSQHQREYSRECRLCKKEVPKQRTAFTTCGHYACSSCVSGLIAKSKNMRSFFGSLRSLPVGYKKKDEIACPFCDMLTNCVNLFEQMG